MSPDWATPSFPIDENPPKSGGPTQTSVASNLNSGLARLSLRCAANSDAVFSVAFTGQAVSHGILAIGQWASVIDSATGAIVEPAARRRITPLIEVGNEPS
jgi:hypothetical protein